jgi:hypothetical protein
MQSSCGFQGLGQPTECRRPNVEPPTRTAPAAGFNAKAQREGWGDFVRVQGFDTR